MNEDRGYIEKSRSLRDSSESATELFGDAESFGSDEEVMPADDAAEPAVETSFPPPEGRAPARRRSLSGSVAINPRVVKLGACAAAALLLISLLAFAVGQMGKTPARQNLAPPPTAPADQVLPGVSAGEIDPKLEQLLQQTGGGAALSDPVALDDEQCEEYEYVWNPSAPSDEVGRTFSRYGSSAEIGDRYAAAAAPAAGSSSSTHVRRRTPRQSAARGSAGGRRS